MRMFKPKKSATNCKQEQNVVAKQRSKMHLKSRENQLKKYTKDFLGQIASRVK